jgi:hypothetical protein
MSDSLNQEVPQDLITHDATKYTPTTGASIPVTSETGQPVPEEFRGSEQTQYGKNESAFTPNKAGLIAAGATVPSTIAAQKSKMVYDFFDKKSAHPGVQNYINSRIGVGFNLPASELSRLSGMPVDWMEDVKPAFEKIAGSPAMPARREPIVKNINGVDKVIGYRDIPATPEIPRVDLSPYKKTPTYYAKKHGELPLRMGVASYDIGKGLSEENPIVGGSEVGAGLSMGAAPFLPKSVKGVPVRAIATGLGLIPPAASTISGAQAEPINIGGLAVDYATGLMSPTELGDATLRQDKNERYVPGMTDILKGTTLPQGHAEGGQPTANVSAITPPNMSGMPGVGYMQMPQSAMLRAQLEHELENQARLRAGATGMGMAIPGQHGVKMMPGNIEAGVNIPVGQGNVDISGYRSINPINTPIQQGGHMHGANVRYTLPFAEGGGVAPYGFRHVENTDDVSLPKGSGWFGHLPNQAGGISTEISADSNGSQYPLLNPMMNRQEINSLLANEQPTDEMYRKAEQFARYRQAQGKSPFISPVGEMHWPLPKK